MSIPRTNEELLTQFRAYLLTERCVSHNTYISYSHDLNIFFLFLAQQQMALLTISIDTIKEFLQQLHANNLSSRSIARKIATLKLLFNYLHIKYGITDFSKKLRTPRQPSRLPHFLSKEEIELLLKAAVSFPLRERTIVFLLYASAMRVSELVSLTIGSLNFQHDTIRVMGKGAKERIIPIPSELMVLIQQYITYNKLPQGENPYLFPVIRKKYSTHLSRQACWLLVKKVWATVGKDKQIWPHQLRHSLATHLLAKGVNLRMLQLLLGHEQLATVQIYTHVETSSLRTLYDKKHPRS